MVFNFLIFRLWPLLWNTVAVETDSMSFHLKLSTLYKSILLKKEVPESSSTLNSACLPIYTVKNRQLTLSTSIPWLFLFTFRGIHIWPVPFSSDHTERTFLWTTLANEADLNLILGFFTFNILPLWQPSSASDTFSIRKWRIFSQIAYMYKMHFGHWYWAMLGQQILPFFNMSCTSNCYGNVYLL